MARGDEPSGLRSPKAQIAVVALLAVGLGVVYWQMVYAPMQEQEQRLGANLKKLEKENVTLIQEERIQSDMEKCRVELDALNRDNELMLPAEAEPVAFLKNLSNMAATAGLEQGATKLLAEAAVQAPPPRPEDKRRADEKKAARGTAGGDPIPCWEKIPGLQADPAAKATFVRVPFVIEVRGTFHQLMRYFWMLHDHANAGRIITVEDLSLSDPRVGVEGLAMTAKFIAVGFREPDGAAPGEEAAEGAPARGGKGQVREATQRREAQVEAASSAGSGGAGAAAPGGAPAAGGQPAAAGAEAGRPADPAASGVDRISKPEAAP